MIWERVAESLVHFLTDSMDEQLREEEFAFGSIVLKNSSFAAIGSKLAN